MSFYAFDIDPFKDKDSDPLFPVRLNEQWGFINIDGKMVIEPQFDYAEDFHDGFAVVRISKTSQRTRKVSFRDSFTGKLKWERGTQNYGFINKSSEFLVEPRYDYSDGFSEGLAMARTGDHEDGLYGYIDKSGAEVIKPKFPYRGFTRNDTNFSEGLAVVKIDRKAAFINPSGRVEIKTDFDHAWMYSEGFAMVRKGTIDKGLYGVIDKKGNPVIDLKFNLAHPFSDGLAGAMKEDWTKGTFGYINKSGEFQIPPKYRRIGLFKDGLAWVWKGDRINASLAIVSMIPFEPYISGTCELIDRSGNVKLSLRGGWVGNYDHEYALRVLGGRYSFIDKTGKECFDKTFNNARAFHNGLAMVQVDGKWGYINRSGIFVWNPSE